MNSAYTLQGGQQLTSRTSGERPRNSRHTLGTRPGFYHAAARALRYRLQVAAASFIRPTSRSNHKQMPQLQCPQAFGLRRETQAQFADGVITSTD